MQCKIDIILKLLAIGFSSYRNHDMRICLSHYSVIPSDDPVITKFISTCSLSESGELSFDKSLVKLVRYKQRKAYHLKNIPRKYVLSVTTVQDLDLRARIPSEDITPHFEIEVSDYCLCIIVASVKNNS